MKKKFNIYEMITQQLTTKIERAIKEKSDFKWVKEWSGADEPMNLVSNKPYKGINNLLLSCSEFENPYFLTFNQIKALGGNLKKGSKSMQVVFWNISNYQKDEDGELVDSKSFFLKYYNVFNVEQVENLNHKRLRELKTDSNKIEFTDIEKIEDFVKRYGIAVKHEKQVACYKPYNDIINMPVKNSFRSVDNYYYTLFHELVHSTGHKSRLDRLNKTAAFGSEDYSKEELCAELGSAFLSSDFKLNVKQENTVSYLKGWLQALKNDTKLLISASSKARKAVEYLYQVQ